MDDREAIVAAKSYVSAIFADEKIFDLRLEEIEHVDGIGNRTVTLSFARPWASPRTRTQEVLENLGATSPVQRTSKVVTIAEDGTVLSVKAPSYPAAAE